jgi:hypothetical protein
MLGFADRGSARSGPRSGGEEPGTGDNVVPRVTYVAGEDWLGKVPPLIVRDSGVRSELRGRRPKPTRPSRGAWAKVSEFALGDPVGGRNGGNEADGDEVISTLHSSLREAEVNRNAQ